MGSKPGDCHVQGGIITIVCQISWRITAGWKKAARMENLNSVRDF
jgi:hypothetical protein